MSFKCLSSTKGDTLKTVNAALFHTIKIDCDQWLPPQKCLIKASHTNSDLSVALRASKT